ncbi:MAG: alpha-1,2-fucosyltransferase [Candidatus Rifleibacteriota bacterium]
MKIVFLSGGLGNQMFQFAAAKSLSLIYGHKLKIDPTYYDMYVQNRVFELERVFDCQFEIASDKDLKAILGWKKKIHQSPFWRRLYRKLPGQRNWIVEPHYHFWPEFLNLSNNCLIEGDWQSYKYFSDFSTQIKDCFKFKQDDFADHELLQRLQSCNSVAIHLRRADYVSNTHTLSWHGVCEADYYQAAVQKLRQAQSNPEFFVFSDDPIAAREILSGISGLNFVEDPGKRKNQFDMMLMSRCRHNIIANSTFSWWAAWINENPQKMVIAPKRWFAQDKLCDSDLIPPDWQRL